MAAESHHGADDTLDTIALHTLDAKKDSKKSAPHLLEELGLEDVEEESDVVEHA